MNRTRAVGLFAAGAIALVSLAGIGWGTHLLGGPAEAPSAQAATLSPTTAEQPADLAPHTNGPPERVKQPQKARPPKPEKPFQARDGGGADEEGAEGEEYDRPPLSVPGHPAVIPGTGSGPGQIVEATADLFGVHQRDVRFALIEGTTLAELAAEAGVSRETLIQGLTAAAAGRLQERVAEGETTQAEADLILVRVTQRLPEIVDATWPGPAQARGVGNGQGRGVGRGR